MSRVFDLPESFLEDENAVLILDENANFYKPQMEHDGVVFVEKCLVRKGKYIPTPLSNPNGSLIAKSNVFDAFLVKETNFQDIGGGMETFEKHYATFPTIWFDYQQLSYRALWNGKINYRAKSGGGDAWDKTRNTEAKATHYYFDRKSVPTIPVPEGYDVGETFRNNFTRTYTIAPESRIGGNWENNLGTIGKTVVIAPDKISNYMGEIYELVRYTFTF